MTTRSPSRDRRHDALGEVLPRAVLFAGLLSAGAVPCAAQVDSALIQAVVEIRIDGGPSQVVPAVSHNSTMLVPLRSFLEMSEIALIEFSPDSSATVLLQPGNIGLRFSPDSGHFALGDSLFALAPLDAVWWDGELYLATNVLDRAFGVSTSMDWANLTVLVGRVSGLPVIRRARRERRRAMLDRPGAAQPPPIVTRPPESLADGGVLEWSFTSPTNGTVDNLALATGLGAKFYGGSVELRHRMRNVAGSIDSDARLSWARAWPTRKWIRQVGIGDVRSNGLRARTIRGVVVTNAPFIRSSEFDTEEVLGRLPTGWEVELYERGRLRGYDEVDALGVFRIPLQMRYGQNPYELVLYGPSGEVIRKNHTIRVPFSRLPAGELEYAVAGGACRYQSCRGMFGADVRYGLSRAVTVQAGSDFLSREADADLWQPYAAVSAAPVGFLRLTGEAVYHGHLRGSIGIEPTTDFRFDFSHSIFDEAGSTVSRTFFERTNTEGSLFWQPRGARGSFFFQLVGNHSTGPFTRRNLQRLSATARRGPVRYSLGLRHDFFQQGQAAGDHRSGIDGSADLLLSGNRWWQKATSVRTGLSLDAGHGFSKIRTAVGRQVAKKARLDIGFGWIRHGGFSLDVGFNTVLSGPRFGTRSHFNTGGGSDGVMFVDGSVAFDPKSRAVHLSDGRDLGRAGISGVVFLDENDNGLQDFGERGLAGVPIRVGGWYEETDANGHFATWDLFPYENSFIEIDQLALDDPRLVPLSTVITVTPTPNSFQSIHVPVVVGAEINGYVLLDGQGLPGVPVVLHNLTIGRTITLMTFSDGAFYQVSIPPGEYDIGVPEEVLERMGASAPTLQINVPSGQGDKRIEELTINVERVSEEPGILDRLIRSHANRVGRPTGRGND